MQKRENTPQLNLNPRTYDNRGFLAGFWRWVEVQRAKPNCGQFPFQLPGWFPLTKCCEAHDSNYTFLRAEAVYLALELNIPLQRLSQWLELTYKPRILQADTQFANCMEREVESSAFLRAVFRGFIRSIFSRIVDSVGWDVWYEGTYDAIEFVLMGRSD